MGDGQNKWRYMESEMNRFETEISSLGSIGPGLGGNGRPGNNPPGRSGLFIPNSVVRRAATTVTTSRPVVSSTPVIISAAPQVYNSASVLGKGPVKSSSTTTTTTNAPNSNKSLSQAQAKISRQLRPSLTPGAPQITTSMIGARMPTPIANDSTPEGSSDIKIKQESSHSEGGGESGSGGGSSTGLLQPKLEPTAGTSNTNPKGKKKKKKGGDEGGAGGGEKKPRKHVRSAGGTVWEDPTLLDWDTSDFRLFCGDLGNDVTDEVLARVFGRYPSFQKAKVVRDKRSNKTKGYGFVSFKDPNDFVRAIRELDGRYVGSRPIKLRKSTWRSRGLNQVRKREKEFKSLMGPKKAKL